MSHIFAGILGAVAMSATFGAVQFASGSSLTGAPETIAAVAQSDAVNRSAKSDRSFSAARTSASRTITVLPAGLDTTSVLVRVPVSVKETGAKFVQTQTSPAQSRRASNMACEPVVSVLTDVAKKLAPGRCVT